MEIYLFMNYKICPKQQGVSIAESKEEALRIVVSATGINKGWELSEKYEFKKGILFYGDADC